MKFKKSELYSAPVLSIGFLIATLFSCNKGNWSKTATVVSEVEVEKRVLAFEKTFGKQYVCDDVSLSYEIINDFYGTGLSANCVDETKGIMFKLVQDVQSLQDLHAKVEFGFQLDSAVSPVITDCQGSLICSNVIGTQLQPINNSFDKIYVYAESEQLAKKMEFFELIERNGHKVDRKNSEYRKLYTHQISNRNFFLPEEILSRSSFDSGGKADEMFKVRSIRSNESIILKTSYTAKQTRGFVDESSTVNKLRLAKPSSCEDIYQSEKVFLCLEKNKSIYLRIENWFIADVEFNKVFEKLKGLPNDLPLIIDVRSNRGGSQKQVVNFMCFIDLESTLEITKDIHYSLVSPKVKYSTSDVLFKDLMGVTNSDLVFTRDKEEQQKFQMPFLSRFTPNCLYPDSLKDRSIKVITEGMEFSANEFFLLLSERMPQMTVIGKHSIGGSGSPITITLPKTRTKLTLSIARIRDQSGDLIEKIGIKPETEFQYEREAAAFEQRIVKFLEQHDDPCAECFESSFYSIL